MGCDIHLYVEKRVNGKWVSADKWTVDKHDGHKIKRMNVNWEDSFYGNRNYDLFAILADVRNGRGFAGVITGTGFVPISEPKGLPVDMCDEIKLESDTWSSDGHSHSWHTLADIFSYDWTQTTKHCGWVNTLEYFEWSRYNKNMGKGPECYCGAVSGISIKHIEEKEMEKKIEEISKNFTVSYSEIIEEIKKNHINDYCEIEWEEPYYSSCPNFWSETIPKLLRLGKPEDIRIVFWFDN